MNKGENKIKKNDVKINSSGSIISSKQKNNRVIIIASIIGVLALIIVLVLAFSGNSSIEKIDGEKIDISKIALSMSDDYKYFDNTIEDFAAVIINDFKENGISVRKNSKCDETDGYGNYCHKVIINNNDVLFIIGTNDKYFETIILEGDINDTKYTGKIFGTVARLYIKDLDGAKFEDEINETFLSSDNLERENGISYVYSHMKFEWSRYNESYKLTFSVSEYDNQEQFKETEEYKNSYNIAIKGSAESEITAELDKYQTLDSVEINSKTGLADVKLKYNKEELTKYVCASDIQYMAKSLVGSKAIGSLQFECINDTGTIYFVKIDSINSISENEINSNTKYYDVNYKQENTNIDKLKAQIVTDYKKSCATYKYKDVLRNPSDYTGKKAYWFGEILQVVDKTSYSATYRVGVSCTKYQYIGGYSCPDTLYVTYYGDGSYIEDDMVKMYGTMDGTQSYTTVMGASVTVPSFNAEYIDLQ